MNRLEIKSIISPNFIGCWYLEDKTISKQIIDFFEKNEKLQKKGATAKGVNENKKKINGYYYKPKSIIRPQIQSI